MSYLSHADALALPHDELALRYGETQALAAAAISVAIQHGQNVAEAEIRASHAVRLEQLGLAEARRRLVASRPTTEGAAVPNYDVYRKQKVIDADLALDHGRRGAQIPNSAILDALVLVDTVEIDDRTNDRDDFGPVHEDIVSELPTDLPSGEYVFAGTDQFERVEIRRSLMIVSRS